GDEARIRGEPGVPGRTARVIRRLDRALAIWYRMLRVGDVGVESILRGRLVERQLAVLGEIHRPRRDAGLRRPRVVFPPPVRAALEHERLRLLQIALVPEIEIEERELDAVAEVLRRRAAEVDVAEL